MSHRIREAMTPHAALVSAVGGDGKIVEADETFVGGRAKNKHAWQRTKGNIGGEGKEAVFSLVERAGAVRSHHVPAVDARTRRPILTAQLERASYLITDGEGQYRILGPIVRQARSGQPRDRRVRLGQCPYQRGRRGILRSSSAGSSGCITLSASST